MEDERVVPLRVEEAGKRTLANVNDVGANFDEYLSLCSDPEVMAELSPLQRAESLLLLARATSVLFAVRLRCTGINPEGHPIRRELERLSKYQEKLQRFISLSKGPVAPTMKLDNRAASRFIEHSLPDLTAEQKRSMREIHRIEAGRVNRAQMNLYKKRKHHTPEKKSVQASAQEFLEKATRELLGDKHDRFKGPLNPIMVVDSSEGEMEGDKEEKERNNKGKDTSLPIEIDSSD